jgi:hypothetical protein
VAPLGSVGCNPERSDEIVSETAEGLLMSGLVGYGAVHTGGFWGVKRPRFHISVLSWISAGTDRTCWYKSDLLYNVLFPAGPHWGPLAAARRGPMKS